MKIQKEKQPKTLAVKIFVYLAAFTVFILLLLWLFQTVFMDDIYQAIRLGDMKKCASSVAEAVAKDDIPTGVANASKKYNACISVYQITGGDGARIASSHIKSACMVHNLSSDEFLNSMYEGAKADEFFFNRVELTFPEGEGPAMSGGTNNPNPTSVVCSTVKTTENTSYLVLVDSEILPLLSTTRTMNYQLAIITVILFFASVILSLIISERLVRPFKKMTKEATLLAKGQYDVNFDSSGFAEAKELGDALNYAAGELSKLDTMQKELIANISHDLRTPLTLISGYSEVMRDIPGEMTPENMQIVIDETARLSSLVSDLTELSRLTGGEQVIKSEYFSLTKTVEETLFRYARLVEKDGYSISFRTEGEAFVFADKTRILQVIYNLINNAVNYTGEDKSVVITQTVENGKVRISVTDTGAGIPKEQLPLIWERYYKCSDFHSRGKVGTGLGLSIVKNILLLHSAEFGVTSREGFGSTFWFELPITNQ